MPLWALEELGWGVISVLVFKEIIYKNIKGGGGSIGDFLGRIRLTFLKSYKPSQDL